MCGWGVEGDAGGPRGGEPTCVGADPVEGGLSETPGARDPRLTTPRDYHHCLKELGSNLCVPFVCVYYLEPVNPVL